MAQDLSAMHLDPDRLEREIEDFARLTGLPHVEAAAAVLRSYGIAVSDLEPTRPLSDDDKRRLGVGRSVLDELRRVPAGRSGRTLT
jgi:hypothetical protein